MMFVLDTTVVSMFRRKKPHPSVAEWIAQTGWRDIATTVVTVTEIQRGIERARKMHPNTAQETEIWLEGMLSMGEPHILPLTVSAARLLGRMYEAPALRHFITTDPAAKQPATGADLAIAAIATAAGAAVATSNVGHYLQVHAKFPLDGLFDPVDRTWHVRPATAQA